MTKIGPRREHLPQEARDWVNAVALRNHTALIGIFLCIARCAGASLGGMPCSVQDRVRKRQKRLFAANQCRRVCYDRPLVVASLLVLSLIAAASRGNELRAAWATSAWPFERLRCPSDYGGRDEAAHQSKRPTDQKASAQDAEAHAPQCAAG
jgi:hypothetical protein